MANKIFVHRRHPDERISKTLYDVIIVGGGMAGLSAAYYLSQEKDRKILLIERGGLGQGVSRDAAGMLAPIHELEFEELTLLQAGRESLALYREWEEFLPPYARAQQNGALEVALHAEDVPYLRRRLEFQERLGLKALWLDGADLRTLEKGLSPQISAGIYAPDDGQIEHRDAMRAIIRELKRRRVDLLNDMRVREWKIEDDGTVRIKTEPHLYDVFRGRAVLLATGVDANLPQPFKIFPVRGQMLCVKRPETGALKRPVRIYSRAYGNAYIVPKDDRILIGTTVEEQGYNDRLTAGGLMDILNKAYRVWPAVYDLEVITSWAGLRPATLDRKPIIGRLRDLPVYFLNGLFRNGILLGPLAGKLTANFINDGSQAPDYQAFYHTFETSDLQNPNVEQKRVIINFV